jgi:Protein of unknown function (DUF2442)
VKAVHRLCSNPEPGTRSIAVDDVRVTDEWLEVLLKDGRRISVPLAWYPRLMAASPADRAAWETCAAGYGIHWPTIDEDLCVEGLLKGTPA